MQPGAVGDGLTLVRHLRGLGETANLNEESFWNRLVENVPVDKLFFHKFFQLKKKGDKADGKARKRGGSFDDLGSVAEESGEEEEKIWQVMKNSMPKADDIDSMGDDDSVPDDFDLSEEDGEGDETPGFSDEEEVDEVGSAHLSDVMDGKDESGCDSEEEWGGVSGLKRKRDKSDEQKSDAKKKRKKGVFPTFASYDEYAKMIEDAGEEED